MFSSTTLFSNNRNVQRARPVGGSEQAKAISLASFSPSKILGTAGAARGCGSTPPRGLLPPVVWRSARFDYEYERNGTANLFMMFAPLEGWRHVKVTDRHTGLDYAHALKDLADIQFFNAKKIVLVQDNLNTHTKASLYEAFPAAEARRMAERFEWHYTPKHGSWLDMAESELGVLSSQCLDRRIPDKAEGPLWVGSSYSN
jgi:hypothetical protein